MAHCLSCTVLYPCSKDRICCECAKQVTHMNKYVYTCFNVHVMTLYMESLLQADALYELLTGKDPSKEKGVAVQPIPWHPNCWSLPL